MDISEPNTTQSISDDQELAKALAGVMPDEPEQAKPEMPTALPQMPGANTDAPAANGSADGTNTTDNVDGVAIPPIPGASSETAPALVANGLDAIKNSALQELRPLIDHVEIDAEEKFNIYLMLIRSTDDSSLIGPAHNAALGIADEKKKTEALLDIIKEIDYLSNKDQ